MQATKQTLDPKYLQRSTHEAMTHQLFDFDWVNMENGATIAAIRLVFFGLHHAAMNAEQITAVGCAMVNALPVQQTDHPVERYTAALDALVKMKVLRRFTRRGERLYEVNY